jgi:nucleoside-diphosphate-sugar epimerase
MAQVKFTIFGGRGFVGRNLATYLEAGGHEVALPARGAEAAVAGTGECLGHAVYAIGLTGNFRQHIYETVEAHVTKHAELIRAAKFQSWLYLSSTRVYGGLGADAHASETAAIPITPSRDSLYDLSKLLGEATCFANSNPAVRVARLSNIYGAGHSPSMFLGSVIEELANTGSVVINEASSSSKDYMAIEDVCELLASIALSGRERLYNVASGIPVPHQAIAEKLSSLTGGKVTFAAGAPERRFPVIDTSRIAAEFHHTPRSLIGDLESLLRAAASERKKETDEQ